MGKLTLSVDDVVILRAKQYAKQHGLSVSEIVESHLSAVAESHVATSEKAPILRAVLGVLKTSSLDDYKKHLDQKYR